MQNSTSVQPLTSKTWLNRLGWAIIILIGGWFLFSVAFKYLAFTESVYDRFWAIKWWVLGHVVAGSLALIVGPFQFWASFRQKYLHIHRTLGKTYLIAILIGAICSFKLAATTALAVSWQWALSLGMLGVMWVITAAMAYRMIRLRRIEQHKEWMIRSYVVTFAFVTFRILLILGLVNGLGEFPDVAPAMGWASWSVPLVITEVCIQWKKM